MYTTEQAAKILGRTRQDIHYHIRIGSIKPNKFGERFIITQADIERLRKVKLGRPRKIV